MTNIAEISDNSTISRIDRHYESVREPRRRLGLSQAGHKCPRFLWYCHHGYIGKAPNGRVLRLFHLGNLLEDQTISDLRQTGVNVHSQQKQVKIEYNGITLYGSIDGIVEGLIESPKTPHLFEHKTASKEKYDDLVKHGSYKKFSDEYYWQIQFYMLGLGLTMTAIFVYCKNDSRLHMDRIKINTADTIDKLQDVFGVISLCDPPERYCPSDDFFEAKWCQFYEECWRV